MFDQFQVLVIVGEASVHEYISSSLNRAQIPFTTVSTVSEALAWGQSCRADLVIVGWDDRHEHAISTLNRFLAQTHRDGSKVLIVGDGSSSQVFKSLLKLDHCEMLSLDSASEKLVATICSHLAFGAVANPRTDAKTQTVASQTRALTEQRKTESLFARIIDNALSIIVVFNREGVVEYVNKTATTVLEYSLDEIIGKKSLWELLPDREAQAIMDLLASQLDSGAFVHFPRSQVMTARDTTVAASIDGSAVFDGSVCIGAIAVVRDLRASLKMEAQLAEAQCQLESRERQVIVAELAGAAAHELNQPLTSIIGYAELLKRKLVYHSEAQQASNIIITEAERMAEIVRKIGQITHYETKAYIGAAKILDIDRASDTTPLPGSG